MIRLKALLKLVPVSYTHLDVYKRQASTPEETLSILPIPPKRDFPAVHRTADFLLEKKVPFLYNESYNMECFSVENAGHALSLIHI